MANAFQLGREGDRVTISGDFGIQDVRRVFAVLHDAINVRGHADIHLDFSRCTAAFQGAMLPLCSHVMSLNVAHIDFRLTLPAEDRIKRIFESAAWAHFICPRDHEYPKKNKYARQLPAARYINQEEQSRLIDELLEKLLSVIPNFNRSAFAAVEWSLNEISDNVLNHSNSAIGGLLQLSIFDPTRHRVEFTISDAGVGVPATLREANPGISSDMDALLEAVKSGVTRNSGDFQGNGLYGALEICRVGGGRFSLNSGNALLRCTNQAVHTRREAVPFAGTTVDSLIDFSIPGLLEKALAVDGRVHKPVDFIEMKYEQDNLAEIVFNMNDHAFSLRSRPAGRPVRTKLANIIQSCPGQQVVVNFSGITVVSSSFADEVIGKLFVELGPMQFMQRVRLVNVTPTVQMLIDRAISQRMQNPHGLAA